MSVEGDQRRETQEKKLKQADRRRQQKITEKVEELAATVGVGKELKASGDAQSAN